MEQKANVIDPDLVIKLVQHDLKVQQLAGLLWDMFAACKQKEMDLTNFYEWKQQLWIYHVKNQ